MSFLAVARRANRVDFVAARVERFGHPLNIPSLPRRVHTFIGNTNRNPFFHNLALQFQQLELVFLK